MCVSASSTFQLAGASRFNRGELKGTICAVSRQGLGHTLAVRDASRASHRGPCKERRARLAEGATTENIGNGQEIAGQRLWTAVAVSVNADVLDGPELRGYLGN